MNKKIEAANMSDVLNLLRGRPTYCKAITDAIVEGCIWRAIALGVPKDFLVTKDALAAFPGAAEVRDRIWAEYQLVKDIK